MQSQTEGKPVVRPRVRVEPKTYMANERTLLHWLSVSSLVAMMALALVRNESRRRSPIVLLTGTTTYCVSLLCMCYALKLYFVRGRLISTGQNVSFDSNGPMVLTAMLAITVVMAAFVQMGVIQLPHLPHLEH